MFNRNRIGAAGNGWGIAQNVVLGAGWNIGGDALWPSDGNFVAKAVFSTVLSGYALAASYIGLQVMAKDNLWAFSSTRVRPGFSAMTVSDARALASFGIGVGVLMSACAGYIAGKTIDAGIKHYTGKSLGVHIYDALFD